MQETTIITETKITGIQELFQANIAEEINIIPTTTRKPLFLETKINTILTVEKLLRATELHQHITIMPVHTEITTDIIIMILMQLEMLISKDQFQEAVENKLEITIRILEVQWLLMIRDKIKE